MWILQNSIDMPKLNVFKYFSNFIPNLDGPWTQHISPGL